MYEIYKFNSV